MNHKKTSSFKTETYKSRIGRIEYLNTPDSFFSKKWVSFLIIMGFVITDTLCLQTVWNLVQTESYVFVWTLALTCAAALDVPMSIAAVEEKKYRQGLCKKEERTLIMLLAIAVFLVAFVFSFMFRVVTKDLTFDIGAGSNLNNTVLSQPAETVGEAETEDLSIWIAAVFNGIIPLLTSISAYVISYVSANPLGEKIMRLEKEKVTIQTNITNAEKALAETDSSEEHCKSLIAREKDLYAEFINELDMEALLLKELVRVMIMEKIGSPEAISALAEEGEQLLQKHDFSEEPSLNLTEHILSQFEDNRSDIIELNAAQAA